MVKITNYHLDTLRDVSERLANLANSLPDDRISFEVEFSTRPLSIYITAYEWKDDGTTCVRLVEVFHWNFDRDRKVVEKERLDLLTKVAEWEVKYGTR